MAYSGSTQVMSFQSPGSMAGVATSLIDISDSTVDLAILIVPFPLKVYQFGVYSTETLGTAVTGSIFLERSTVIAGSDTTVFEMDVDSVNLASGDATLASQIYSTGSEATAAGDVLYSGQMGFPVVITAPQVLSVRMVTTALAGELVPFIVARWLGLDYRSTEHWTS